MSNPPAHKYVLVQDFLMEERVVQLSHPPYSPDLSPCDFFPVSFTEDTLSDRLYESQSATGSEIYHCLHLRFCLYRLEKMYFPQERILEGLK